MKQQQNTNNLPPNYEELKKAANRTANWKERLAAVEELGKWKSEQTIDILLHRMQHDPVRQVQVAAYESLKDLGENVHLPEPHKYELIKGTSKAMLRIKKSLPADHSFEDFEAKLQKTRVDIYDTYKGDKGEGFDQWLKDQWQSMPGKK
ncbi:HEAT repeat domain-containing protein [Planococcus salinus]|uniref:HEAT repeat domain-containing protein n=1 Tax=Planococcus salinus TaxID=1848460 RepID=A0A3M8P6Z9_9BACL|nr:HEAT repeat domain-containing protein [Planococcus salinus]RNF39050.1 HEAT repeat domain-containing protein [Planococcus salinus]